MARRRTGAVAESLETLEQLERHCLDELQRQRIGALKLIKVNPTQTDAEIAALVGCSERSVRRWWSTYLKQGLDVLLELNGVHQDGGARMDRKGLDHLGKMIRGKELTCLDDVREWLRSHYGVRYSRSEVQYILHTKLGIDPPGKHQEDTSLKHISFPSPSVSGSGISPSQDIILFLNALPLTDNAGDWTRAFRNALLILFKDISHIAININQSCNIANPETYRPMMVLRQHNANAARVRRDVMLYTQEEEGRPAEQILEEFRVQGRPLEQYHPPIAFDYYYQGQAYLGSIFLFQDIKCAPISEQTYAAIDALEPFIIQSMAHQVMCYACYKPAEHIFREGFRRMVNEGKLSPQEQRVVSYHLLGYSYEEMAELLSISAKTVKKHISTIHQKTGTRRLRELFARYFTPRIGFDSGGTQPEG